MKKLIKLSFTALLMLSMFAACSSSDDDPIDPTLSVEPSTAIAFSAAGTESFEIAVTTNQKKWEVTSDQSWCIVTKRESENKFIVTTTRNGSETARPKASVSVTAGTAQAVTVAVTQSGLGAELTVSPSNLVTFTTEGTEAIELQIHTNQGSWNAVVNQTWCTLTKEGNKLTLKATRNEFDAIRNATITISSGNAADVIVMVTQEAGEQPVADNGTTIWDDTHWRLYGLKGRPKSLIHNNELVEFNAEGKVVYEGARDKSYYTKFKYDSNGRMIEVIEGEQKEGGDYAISKFEYGNHSKYIPFFVELDGIDYLTKGISTIKRSFDDDDGKREITITFTVAGSTVKASGEWGSIDIGYAGDYPTSIALKDKYDGEWMTSTRTYTYGKNYKYSEFIKNNPRDKSVSKTKYSTDETIYLLPIREEFNRDNGQPQFLTYEYDTKGRLTKSTLGGGATTIYSKYKIDAHGNWIERHPGGGNILEIRTITYY